MSAEVGKSMRSFRERGKGTNSKNALFQKLIWAQFLITYNDDPFVLMNVKKRAFQQLNEHLCCAFKLPVFILSPLPIVRFCCQSNVTFHCDNEASPKSSDHVLAVTTGAGAKTSFTDIFLSLWKAMESTLMTAYSHCQRVTDNSE